MRHVRAILAEIVGLFVDDGSLALGVLLWCAAVGISTSLLPSLIPVGAPIWFVGCALVQFGCTLRSARPQSPRLDARDGAARVLTRQLAAANVSYQHSRGGQ